jgi:hypothetical protein
MAVGADSSAVPPAQETRINANIKTSDFFIELLGC